MSNELTDVRCPCGADYPADSYDAGFIAGSGMCQNCDAALPPKDICTCPSGDGSLRHPCPAHPAVEQAGGDERVVGWRERILAAHPNSDPGFWPEALLVEHMAAEIADLRAALAQPSQAPADEKPGDSILCSGCFAKGVGPEHFDEAGKCLVRQQTEPLGAEFAQVLSDNLPELLSTAQAEQAEAERPEVVAWRYGSSGGILSDKACLDEWKSGGEYQSLMTVAQHERIVKAWIERWKAYIELSAKIAAQRDAADARLHEVATACATAEQERDAALARVAELTATRNRYGVDAHYFNKNLQRILRDFESFTPDELARSLIILAKVADEKVVAQHSVLEKQEPVATIAKVPGEDWNGLHFYRDLQGMQPGTKLYAAPVAQAQQLHDLDKQCRDDVARALGLRPSQERGFAWSYLLASIKSCVKASEDAAQAQHSVPERLELTDDLKNILGRPNFTCTHLAQALRQIGFVIDRKAEAEQAACLHWMLNHYLANGANWKVHAEAELKAAAPGKEVGHE